MYFEFDIRFGFMRIHIPLLHCITLTQKDLEKLGHLQHSSIRFSHGSYKRPACVLCASFSSANVANVFLFLVSVSVPKFDKCRIEMVIILIINQQNFDQIEQSDKVVIKSWV